MTLLLLVGHDGTDHGGDALALARTISGGRDVRRLVVHVIDQVHDAQQSTRSATGALGSAARARLEGARRSVTGDERFEVVVARSPAQGLHEQAEQHHAALVSLGARHHPFTLSHIPTSTVAGRLLSGGPCAVAVAPDAYARDWSTPARIVVGVDGSDEARGALAEAVALSAQSGATIDLVCAFAPTGDANAALRRAVEARRAVPEGQRGVSRARPGSPGAVIAAFAAERGAGLIVVGSRGRGPLGQVLLGSTGRHVLHGATLAVLVVPRSATVTGPAAEAAVAVAS